MIVQKEYPSLRGHAFLGTTSNFRYHLLPHDFQTLYRKFSRLRGIDITKKAQYNLHDWLDKQSPSYIPELKDAIFHYAPRCSTGERLEVSISTREMDDASWDYGHHKQIVMDGTFGVVSSRMLLFIVLGVDQDRKGIPLVFFLFSAPSGSKATHGGYDREVLTRSLRRWRTNLENQRRQEFIPLVAITDCDIKERSALLAVWPAMCLLLCKFHVRQCWTNKRKSVIKGQGFWRYHVLERLRMLEDRSVRHCTL